MVGMDATNDASSLVQRQARRALLAGSGLGSTPSAENVQVKPQEKVISQHREQAAEILQAAKPEKEKIGVQDPVLRLSVRNRLVTFARKTLGLG